MLTTKSETELALARADVYRFLSIAFGYPDKDRLEILHDLASDLDVSVGLLPYDMKEEFAAFAERIPTADLAALQPDFTEMFLTRMFCPCTETTYGKNSFNQPNILGDISGFYKAFGFIMKDDANASYDHITMELEFMSFLELKIAYALDQTMEENIDISLSAEKRFLEQHIGKVGHIHILVNNAGIYKQIDMLSCTFEEWKKHVTDTMQINMLGLANLTFLVTRNMVENGGGKIINVSSRGAFRGEPLAPAYGASKAAANQFNQSLARLLAPKNVFTYVVAPGFVETEMSAAVLKSGLGDEIRSQSPLNRVAKPEEVAQAILLMASQQTEFMTGTIVDVNGASYLRS